jgi:predicted component of type VI protein secretion system
MWVSHFYWWRNSMKLRMFAILFLLAVATCSVGCDAGANKPSNEPVVQDLEIETGEAFDPSKEKKDGK